ncbi:hypothetical protein PoB_001277200 [Plakobranchus ocellatus]|uniref:Uncharacterized protein n=1 Tax=Plakobranchus ocellatus TaxID=259542 RepID=A0AAV3YTK3_9GAST|nr:hypothetical protein PoB_001277200 [Plakobranchus ocellatus]
MQRNTSKTAYTTFSLRNPVLKKSLEIGIGKESLKRDDLQRYLDILPDPRLCLRRHIEEVANSVRYRTTIAQGWQEQLGTPRPSPCERFITALYDRCSNTRTQC